MRTSIVLFALLATAMSGCLGIPEGAVAPGDTVQVVVDIYDADTDEQLVTNTAATFVVGNGDSGFGYEFERQLIALPEGYEGTLVVRNDPSLAWSGTVTVDSAFSSDLVQTAPVESYEQAFGPAAVGDIFRPQGALFNYEVVDIDAGLVAYKPLPEQGQRDPVPVVGAILVTEVQGDQLVQWLEPDVGATFRVAPPSPFNPTTPLGLAPGSYRALSGDGATITYEQSAASNPNVAGRDLRIEVRIMGVESSGGDDTVEPVGGNYGVRQSPVINGAPTAIPSYGAMGKAPAHDDHDGHNH